ncbi:MAG: hypothetical protein D6806_16700, partial [Deltaproteobacteria bacterium]
YNSLGYRDVEPAVAQSSENLVIVVGDSYVWGDGIARYEDTISALLRKHLDKLAPGRYVVMSAAYPGLGVYGYLKALEKLVPEFRPNVVVVGYLGRADLDPLDAQRIIDLVPGGGSFDGVFQVLGVLATLHESKIGFGEGMDDVREKLMTYLENFAKAGKRSILIDYFGDGQRTAGIEVVSLPEPWRYRGRSELWYGKDIHPKPSLNRLLAGLLADRIVNGHAQR